MFYWVRQSCNLKCSIQHTWNIFCEVAVIWRAFILTVRWPMNRSQKKKGGNDWIRSEVNCMRFAQKCKFPHRTVHAHFLDEYMFGGIPRTISEHTWFIKMAIYTLFQTHTHQLTMVNHKESSKPLKNTPIPSREILDKIPKQHNHLQKNKLV